MEKICIKCNKKIGFFERMYEDNFCKECFEIIQKERAEEIERKKEEEQKRRLAVLLLEQKKEEERIEKEQKIHLEKLNSARDYFLYTSYYYTILDKIDSIPFHYYDIFNNTIKNKFDIIKLLLYGIIKELPNNFNINDIKEISTYRNSSKIIDNVLKPYVVRKLNYKMYYSIIIEDQKYSNISTNMLDDIEYNSSLISNCCLTDIDSTLQTEIKNQGEIIDACQKSINEYMDMANKPNKYDSNKCIAYANETQLKQTYEIIYIYYFYALVIIYYIFFNKVVDNIINTSELYKIYNKLKIEIHNEDYIIQKLFSLYSSLYKNDFDIIFENEKEFSLLTESFKFRDKIVDKSDYIDINKNILNIDINQYINNNNDDDIIYGIHNEIFFNITSYRKYLSIDDIFDIFFYSKQVLEIYKEIKKQQAFKEKERILNDNFEEEKVITNDLLDYSAINNGYEFESFIANLYKTLGYNVLDVTSKSGDQGADVIIEKDNIKYAIQVKYYTNPVGNKAIQEIVAAKSFYKTDKAMVVTNSTFTPPAITLAKANDVILIDGNELEKLINQAKKN